MARRTDPVKAAESVIRQVWHRDTSLTQVQLPIDPLWLCDQLGLSVHRVDGLPDDLAGWVEPPPSEPDPYKLAQRLGLTEYFPAQLPDHVIEVLRPRADGKRRVCLNSDHSIERSRWTCAHELGHYVLHAEFQSEANGVALFRSGGRSWIEREADVFARSLLMPDLRVRNQWIATLDADERDPVDRMERLFAVSREAMSNRLRELGLS